MRRQEKVVKKINRDVGDHSVNLGKKNNDECYTPFGIIWDELELWGQLGKFRGKNIICPCDWDIDDTNPDIFSIEITYREDDVEVITNNAYQTVKGVKVSLWDLLDENNKPAPRTIDLAEDEIEDFLRNKLTCNFVRVLTARARHWGIKSITASGYDPETGRGYPFQDIDYSKYDVCITNPPFSLYKEFMNCIVGNIDFVVLAPFMNRVTPNIGLPLMLRQAYLGFYNCIHINFYNPTIENEYKEKKVCCDWITSYSEAQEERNNRSWKTGISYDLYKEDYKEMPNMTMKDGTHPIKVGMGTVPDDYDGWMFGPVNLLHNMSFDEYEWYGTNFKGYFNTTNPEANPFSHKLSNTMMDDETGKHGFHGIIFRRKI